MYIHEWNIGNVSEKIAEETYKEYIKKYPNRELNFKIVDDLILIMGDVEMKYVNLHKELKKEYGM